jgi:hypothetical protein
MPAERISKGTASGRVRDPSNGTKRIKAFFN